MNRNEIRVLQPVRPTDPDAAGRFVIRRLALMVMVMVLSMLPVTMEATFLLTPWFSDGAVIQRQKAVELRGRDQPGAAVSVDAFGMNLSATAHNDGSWSVEFPPMEGGLSSDVLITGSREIRIAEVRTGDVWLLAGQSNLIQPLSDTRNADRLLKDGFRNDAIRIWHEPGYRGLDPVRLPSGAWTEFSARTLSGFSALAAYFGMELTASVDVPIGLIVCGWGNTRMRYWLPSETVAQSPELRPYTVDSDNELIQAWSVQYSTYLDWKFSAMKSGQRYRGFIPIRPGETGDIYNGMIRPFRRMPLKGIVYYQGESDVYQPDHLRMLLPHLIRSWRGDRGDPLTPFLVVQIPGWDFNRERPLDEIARQIMPESRMAELREGQLLAVQSQPGTELVVSLDVGEKDEVHPTLKLPLAQRLARAALHLAYQRDTLFRGPRLTGATFLEDRVVLKFSDVGDGLRAAEDPVNGFSIARSNMVHFKPVARITAPDTVTLFSPVWKNPVSARFAWNDFPVTTLTDSEGNPATSFRVTIDEQ